MRDEPEDLVLAFPMEMRVSGCATNESRAHVGFGAQIADLSRLLAQSEAAQ